MVEAVAALHGRLDENLEVLDNLGLTAEVIQRVGP
jgi:hypothetical protein